MNAPQISVVLPVYNAETYLASALSSLQNQSEVSLQIIAVDDGSTDGSLAILRAAAETDARLTVLSQNNSGLSSARNVALHHARGSWIAFMDSDDWLHPQAFEQWLQYAKKDRLDFLVGNGFCFNENPQESFPARPICCHQPWNEVMCGADWIIKCVTAHEWPHYVWLQLIRRDFLERSGVQFIESQMHEDILWTTCLALNAQRVGFHSEPFYGYRAHGLSLTGSICERLAAERASSYLAIIQRLVSIAYENHQNAPLRNALLRHANREAHHFVGLVRKRINDPSKKQALAREFLQSRLIGKMFQGAANSHERWRAFRCWLVLRRALLRSKKLFE